jgi:hypothetical protein
MCSRKPKDAQIENHVSIYQKLIISGGISRNLPFTIKHHQHFVTGVKIENENNT